MQVCLTDTPTRTDDDYTCDNASLINILYWPFPLCAGNAK
ncbi:hypothetical protein KPSA1_00778 [Pseudomonas syringae pv. actinidiae]|uniref:Uncharacterized protein n=2 Tax=Pseudomonas syringae TaxID=317 RepID=A0A2V0Q4C9_PSESF|nr:hypothetical protein KPSA1_00778 [Pseudomonas syringae pv. actinidiae]GBH15170.1 hypothetical protein KPSA3_01091 [Pseudomonas syringae pv. actinidiae]